MINRLGRAIDVVTACKVVNGRRRSFGFLGDVRSHSLSSFFYYCDIQTTTKLFIRHILHSCRDSNFPQYLVYKGKHLNYIEILGIVVRELTREQDSEEVECR